MNITTFIKELEKINIKPSNEQLEALNIYKEMLTLYNKKFNLTAITDEEGIYLKHFYDSLTITKVIDLNKDLKVLDIGTGAGFPGLVLKIFFPNLKVTLLDSNHKKIAFLNEVINKLQLQDIMCLYSRVEDLNDEYRESFDIITSRAVAHLRILLELSFPYLKVNGYFIPLKGDAKTEIGESLSTLNVLKGKIIEQEEFNLPIENSVRTILKIEKQEKTPLIYPRNYAIIKKKILK